MAHLIDRIACALVIALVAWAFVVMLVIVFGTLVLSDASTVALVQVLGG